jgi:hypothetical protein
MMTASLVARVLAQQRLGVLRVVVFVVFVVVVVVAEGVEARSGHL